MTRAYHMKARAERHADTRRRIVEAALQLHRTMDPQRITVTEIARRAGVERPTVLRHFNDRVSLLMACTFGDPIPAEHADDWALEPNPEVRLATALSEQYSWYRRNHKMLHHLLDLIESDTSLTPRRAVMEQMRKRAHEVLCAGWDVRKSVRPKLELAVQHAFDFWSWLSLAEAGLTDEQASEFTFEMVRDIAHR
ncbi:MAG TPA: TetR/AcrR family transcriptional regulator [Candidatus Dormibacteraeota bacterium]|nr:TetR/AcrR family transcriptional regulator [Candidatus Dormibacteraeota bacterium]